MSKTTLNDNVVDEEMSDVQADKYGIWKANGWFTAMLAIGTVIVLSAAVYGGYWWGSSGAEMVSAQSADVVAPVPAGIESKTINMEE